MRGERLRVRGGKGMKVRGEIWKEGGELHGRGAIWKRDEKGEGTKEEEGRQQ